MAWYTASIIISCRLKSGMKTLPIPVYENQTLICAANREDAFKKAEKYIEEYIDIDDSLRLNGESAYWKFEGIRKLIEARHHLDDELDVVEIKNGTELSYSYFEIDSEDTLKKLASGESVIVEYLELE